MLQIISTLPNGAFRYYSEVMGSDSKFLGHHRTSIHTLISWIGTHWCTISSHQLYYEHICGCHVHRCTYCLLDLDSMTDKRRYCKYSSILRNTSPSCEQWLSPKMWSDIVGICGTPGKGNLEICHQLFRFKTSQLPSLSISGSPPKIQLQRSMLSLAFTRARMYVNCDGVMIMSVL